MPTPSRTPTLALSPQSLNQPHYLTSGTVAYPPPPPPPSYGPLPSSRRASLSTSRSRASSALVQAGLGLLALPIEADSLGRGATLASATEMGREGSLDAGPSRSPRSRQVSFPGESAPKSSRPYTSTGSPGLPSGKFDGAEASGSAEGGQQQRKTSGPRAFLRRARSFGANGGLGTTTTSGPTLPPVTLPPSPPLPSPPLRPTSSLAQAQTGKDKERASNEGQQPWLLSPNPSTNLYSSSSSSLRLGGEDGERKASALLKRRSFSLWRRTDSIPPPTTRSPVEPHLAAYAPPAPFTPPHDLPAPATPPRTSTTDAPSLPLFDLSNDPYRMSWSSFSHEDLPASPSRVPPSPEKVPSLAPPPPRIGRPHSSSGPPGGGSWTGRPTGLFVVSPAAEEVREETVGLGFEIAGNGSVKRRSTLTRLVRSSSDAASRGRPHIPAQARPPTPSTLPRARAATTESEHLPVSPAKPSFALLNPAPAHPSHSPERAPRSRRPTTANSTSSVLSLVTGFFGSSSSSPAHHPMSRSSSARSSGSHTGTGATGGDLGEFGALFDAGGAKKSPRKRGLSVGNPLFGSTSSSSSPGRTRAGSSSSLSNAWVPPGSTSTLTVPPAGEPAPGSRRGSAEIVVLRRRLSVSSTASREDSLLHPGLPPGQANRLTPPPSPTVIKKAPSVKQSVKAQESESPQAYVDRLGCEVRKSEVARLLAAQSVLVPDNPGTQSSLL